MPTESTVREILQILSALGVTDSEDVVFSWCAALKGYDDDEVRAAAKRYARDGEKRPIPKYIVGIIHEMRNSHHVHTDMTVVHDILTAGTNLNLYDGVIVRLVNICTGKIPWDGVDRKDVAACIAFMEMHKHDWGDVLREWDKKEQTEKYGPNWERCRDIGIGEPVVKQVEQDIRGGDMVRVSDVMGGV